MINLRASSAGKCIREHVETYGKKWEKLPKGDIFLKAGHGLQAALTCHLVECGYPLEREEESRTVEVSGYGQVGFFQLSGHIDYLIWEPTRGDLGYGIGEAKWLKSANWEKIKTGAWIKKYPHYADQVRAYLYLFEDVQDVHMIFGNRNTGEVVGGWEPPEEFPSKDYKYNPKFLVERDEAKEEVLLTKLANVAWHIEEGTLPPCDRKGVCWHCNPPASYNPYKSREMDAGDVKRLLDKAKNAIRNSG